MSENSKIEWTDVTDNIIAVEGGGWWCRKISPGCANCYAAKLNQNAFYGGNKLPYTGAPPKLILREKLMDSWQRQRVAKRHFVASMTDVFGDWVPQEWVNKMLIAMLLAPNQTFQVLTKRPDVAKERIEWFLRFAGATELPQNIWIGTSVEDQKRAEERIPILLSIPAKVRFLSCEPLLGPLDLIYPDNIFPGGPQHCCNGRDCGCMGRPIDPPLLYGIDWVIGGGESGPGARPMHPDWIRSIRDQCQGAGVPFLFKQWGEFSHDTENPIPTKNEGQFCYTIEKVGKKKAGRLLDGREWNDFPANERRDS